MENSKDCVDDRTTRLAGLGFCVELDWPTVWPVKSPKIMAKLGVNRENGLEALCE